MNKKFQKSILAGIIGSAIMSVVTMVEPMIGMPKISPPEMLSGILGIPIFVGWLMHFMIGIIFAFFYTYLCIIKWKISNVYLKGAVFGIIVFVFAQIMIAILGAIMPMPKMEDSLMLIMLGSLIAHIAFGMTVAKTVGNAYDTSKNG
jgi:hypothetical protein